MQKRLTAAATDHMPENESLDCLKVKMGGAPLCQAKALAQVPNPDGPCGAVALSDLSFFIYRYLNAYCFLTNKEGRGENLVSKSQLRSRPASCASSGSSTQDGGRDAAGSWAPGSGPAPSCLWACMDALIAAMLKHLCARQQQAWENTAEA